MDYAKNQRYFAGVSYKGPVWMIVIGAVVALIGLGVIGNGSGAGWLFAGWLFLLIGLGLLGGGIALMVSKKNSVVSDSEYDAEVAKNLKNLRQKALNKLGLDEDEVKEADPISFDNYVYKGATNAKRGNDGLWRTNKYSYVILFFSTNEVHCYEYNFDTTFSKQTESTDVYFYKDIVSVSTASDTVKVGSSNIEYEYFKLTTTGGNTLSVSLRDVNNAQRSINAMRTLLKAKKQA